MIDTEKELLGVLPRLRDAEWLAVDMEADSLHSYPEKVCLIQLSITHHDLLIDPLAGFDLAPLWETLAGRELIMHGADYDLRLFHRCHGFAPESVFDTMLAARAVGMREFGLTNLANSLLGVKLEKSSQRANWSLRPLTKRMITYAANDSHYLRPIATRLHQRLAELGRIEWHRQMCAQLVTDAIQAGNQKKDGQWRLKGADRLSPRGLAVLRELWRWRERVAVAANRPPFFILSHDRLLDMSENGSAGVEYSGWIPKRYTPDRREGLHRAVRRGMAVPEEKLPAPRRARGPRLHAAERRKMDELRRRRDDHALRLDLDPTLIASKATLGELARSGNKSTAELLPWQRGLLED